MVGVKKYPPPVGTTHSSVIARSNPILPDRLATQPSRPTSRPRRRVTQPDEVASMIVFLWSAANTNTTGEAVRAAGHFLTPG